jgi:hypothetical protein
MKLALDVWYELWEKADGEGATEPNRHLEEEDDYYYYPWREDYLRWVGGEEARAEAPFGKGVP